MQIWQNVPYVIHLDLKCLYILRKLTVWTYMQLIYSGNKCFLWNGGKFMQIAWDILNDISSTNGLLAPEQYI